MVVPCEGPSFTVINGGTPRAGKTIYKWMIWRWDIIPDGIRLKVKPRVWGNLFENICVSPLDKKSRKNITWLMVISHLNPIHIPIICVYIYTHIHMHTHTYTYTYTYTYSTYACVPKIILMSPHDISPKNAYTSFARTRAVDDVSPIIPRTRFQTKHKCVNMCIISLSLHRLLDIYIYIYTKVSTCFNHR